jgi:hypothetical protein
MIVETEDVTPLTMERREYILKMLGKDKPENWIRISQQEFTDFGGYAFFMGCVVEYMNEKVFATSPAKGWGSGPSRKVRLPIRITSPGGKAWAPGGSPYYTTTTSSSSINITTNTIASADYRITNTGQHRMNAEGNAVEHHINREKLIEVVTDQKEDYLDVLSNARALYRDELQKKSEAHLEGKIPSNEIFVKDKDGNRITIPASNEELFNNRLQMLELDSRKTIVLQDTEYSAFVLSSDTNVVLLKQIVEKLEDLQ